MEFDISGHRALVTGSSRGIGSAIAIELAKGGADVIVHGLKKSASSDEVVRQISATGRECYALFSDLCKPENVKEMISHLADIDILVLNASLQIKKPWMEITLDDYDRQMNCNYLSSLLLMQHCAKNMIEKGWGRIVTIGSVQELKPHPEMLIYSSSKCAQSGLTRSLAAQLAEYGITVNNVAPGVINTDRNTEALADKEYMKKVMSGIPCGYVGEKNDIAGVVRLLCSQEGRYITGQNIFVDGGKSL